MTEMQRFLTWNVEIRISADEQHPRDAGACEDIDVCSLGGISILQGAFDIWEMRAGIEKQLRSPKPDLVSLSTAEGKSDLQSSPRNHCAPWRGTRLTLDGFDYPHGYSRRGPLQGNTDQRSDRHQAQGSP
jgi:hypothetical protein